MRWLGRWWRRLRGKKPTVLVPVSEELYRVYRLLANREGLLLQDWARNALNAAVPRAELLRLQRSAVNAAGLDAAFANLDADLQRPTLPALPPAPLVHGHPCANLELKYPDGYSSRDCQGSCSSRRQGFTGRACHWTSLVANQCEAFEPRGHARTRLS